MKNPQVFFEEIWYVIFYIYRHSMAIIEMEITFFEMGMLSILDNIIMGQTVDL